MHDPVFRGHGQPRIYHDGWMASPFGPRTPWVPGLPKGIREWTPDKDKWELYNLEDDWSQANDLADKMPEKLAEMKDIVPDRVREEQGRLPIGGGLWIPILHPELRLTTPYTEWTFPGDITRMPEFCAPALGNKPNVVTIDAEIPDNANGVLYALGGFSGGLACYVKDGMLSYEYNLFELSARTSGQGQAAARQGENRSGDHLCPTEARRSAQDRHQSERQGSRPPARPVSAPLLFTANDCLDIGTDLGSPVSRGLLRPGAVQVQRQDRASACEIPRHSR